MSSEEWLPITDAIKRLKAENIDISRNKMSRLISRNIIKTKSNPLDARVRLVDLVELRAIYQEFGHPMGDDESGGEQ